MDFDYDVDGGFDDQQLPDNDVAEPGSDGGWSPPPWEPTQVEPVPWIPMDNAFQPSVLHEDTSLSGNFDRVSVDLDGDGLSEVQASFHDGKVFLFADLDGDGTTLELAGVLTPEELAEIDPPLHEELRAEIDAWQTHPTFTAVQDVEALERASPYWFEQAENGLCAPASIAQIVAEYSGAEFADERYFAWRAEQAGLLSQTDDGYSGMLMEQAMWLLEDAGVPATYVTSASFDMLDDYLQRGHGIILGVNSSDIWGLEGPRGLDHALVIREIDLGQGVAVLSDPGNPEGNGWTVPLEVLQNAWAEGDNTMIIAEQPAPAAAQVAAGERVESAPVGGEVSRDDHDAAIERFRGAVDPEAPSVMADGQLLTSSWSDAVTSVVRRAPWILVPVTIGASHLVSRRS
jgi:hypothetical protein